MPHEKKPKKGDGRARSTVGQPSRKPLDRGSPGIPPTVDLAATLSTPNGGEAPRCQALKRGGGQCGAPARKGYRVCARHGAGLTPRPATATQRERKAGGRPPTHGLYSKAGRRRIAEVVAELEAAQTEIDNSDAEMMVLRGTLSFLLGQADVHEAALDKVGGTYQLLERTLSHQTLDPTEARAVGQAMMAADRLLGRSESWVRALMDAARFVIKGAHERSQTRAKHAEAKALETLAKYIQVLRGIMHDVLDEDQLDVVEGRLLREVFAPNGLEIPGRDEVLVA